MQTINIHEAKTNLSRLIEKAVNGEPFIIAKAGKPLVQVSRLDSLAAPPVKRLGFLTGQIMVPDDFDRMGSEEIERLFGGRQ
ncbi:MAG: type II toxin-antitoxin system prevent-host-death family antitoxin [Deltaproteobacteria bacterium]|nr:type II toxin-antitoxin system prevent-host-death family antitoxin [Candidatus Anaeroferrophillacea bacterium]